MNITKSKRIFNTYPNSMTTTPYPAVYTGVTGDTTVVVPAGYILELLTFLNSTANIATISVGTAAGATDVFALQSVNGSGTNSGLTTFVVNFDRAISGSTTLYIHDDGRGSWNSANVTVYLVLRKIV